MTAGVRTGKAQNERMFSGLPPKADFPILKLLPPPALRERGHRGLVRWLVASARAYVGFVRANVAEYDITEVYRFTTEGIDSVTL